MALSICDALAKEFTASARAKGDEYVEGRRVRLGNSTSETVEATVLGTGVYRVWIDREVDEQSVTFVASCECPYFLQEFAACKHLWATFRVAERQGYLGAREPMPSRIELVLEDPDSDQGMLTPEDLGAELEADDPAAFGGFERRSLAERVQLKASQAAWSAPPPKAPIVAQRPPAPDPGSVALTTIEAHLRASETSSKLFRHAGQDLIYVLGLPGPGQRGGATVRLMTRSLKKNGEWTKPKQAVLSPTDIGLSPAQDRPILAALSGGVRTAYSYRNFYWASTETASEATFLLTEALAQELVPVIARTGRAFLEIAEPSAAPPPGVRPEYWTSTPTTMLHPCGWDDGPPWRFEPSIRKSQTGWTLSGCLLRGDGQTLALADVLAANAGLIWTRGSVARSDVGLLLPVMTELMRTSEIVVLERDGERLSLALARLGANVDTLPTDLRIERVEGVSPTPWLRLVVGSRLSEVLEAELRFDYSGSIVPGELLPVWFDPDRRRLVRRDLSTEMAAAERLYPLGFRNGWNAYTRQTRLELPSSRFTAAVSVLIADGWRVEAEGKRFRLPTAVQLSVRSGIDWFDLDARVEFGDSSVPLTDILGAVGRRDSALALGDGSAGLLPADWLRKYLPLVAAGEAVDGRVRFKHAQTALLDALLEMATAHAIVDVDAGFRRARDELARLGEIGPADAPASFVGQLRHYQREGLGWLQFLQRVGFGGCLADDMGLGKTIMVLALLDARRTAADREGRPSIVVVPRSLVHNWLDEASRFTPSLRVLDFSAATRTKDGRPPDADVLLVTYGTLRRDVLRLKDVAADYVILDEAQAIKNANTAAAKAARLLTAKHRLVLTGTPIENHLGELWSLFEFLNPGILGRSASFHRVAAGETDAETVNLLSRGLRPFMLRRTKQQVARELPARTEQTLVCELSKPERTLYERLRAQYRVSVLDRVAKQGVSGARMHILEALLRLRQAACHPGLVDRSIEHPTSAKLELLLSQVQEVLAENHKALVFSQFTMLLGLVRHQLDLRQISYAYLDGKTRDRAACVKQFQEDPGCRLFLISLKAGGVGLNLTAAEYVFLLDPWWNPAVEAQAIDRTHRIGQTREVFAYRIVAEDTIETKILELQQRKRALADAVLVAGAGGLKGLQREDLDLLLS